MALETQFLVMRCFSDRPGRALFEVIRSCKGHLKDSVALDDFGH